MQIYNETLVLLKNSNVTDIIFPKITKVSKNKQLTCDCPCDCLPAPIDCQPNCDCYDCEE